MTARLVLEHAFQNLVSAGRSVRRGVRAALAIIITCIVAVGGALPAAPPAGAVAAVLFVAPSGTDAPNTCASAATPCATITYALTQAAPAATINVSGTTTTTST